MKLISKLFPLGAIIMVAFFVGGFFISAPLAQAAATLTVCASGCNATTIQAAITAATAGDTINVASGTYTEQIIIDKNLHLAGAGSGLSIIQAPDTIDDLGDALATIIMVRGGLGVEAEISGFTVTGPGPTGCGSIRAGIVVRDGADAYIHNNRIQDIQDSTFSGCQNGQGIWVGRKAWGTKGTATITNNVITGYQKGGIVVDNTGSSARIIGNTITGAGRTNVTAQNGIQISRGATGVIEGNIVSGHYYLGNVYFAGGVTFIQPLAGTVFHPERNFFPRRNEWFANQVNFLNFGRTAPVQ